MGVDLRNRELLIQILLEHDCNVSFQKANGETRIMSCTLNPAMFENTTIKEENDEVKTRKQNLEVLPVWDLENKGWRSFRLDSLNHFSYHDGEGHNYRWFDMKSNQVLNIRTNRKKKEIQIGKRKNAN
jgi:hypothetical protein